jgi:cytochrome P450
VLLAGADTTGTAFQAFMKYIMSHPDKFDKMMAEIDAATRDGKLSADMPQYEEVLEHCPYYIACVREAMRLNPSAPNIFPRLAPKGGLDLFGRHVPGGAEVTCNPWLVHRDAALYGADAEAYRPERWLEDPERAREYAKYSMTFGYGARVCLGRDVANMELFKAPLQFFRTFRPTIDRSGTYVYKGGISYFEDMWISIDRRAPVV